jgi:hypothetical protein
LYVTRKLAFKNADYQFLKSKSFSEVNYLHTGDIKFQNSYIQRSKFVLFDEKIESRDVLKFMKNKWFDKFPEFVISINGALDKVTLSERMVKLFQRSLIHAITKMNAWVITAGTNDGVMRLVGDSVKWNLKTKELNIIIDNLL